MSKTSKSEIATIIILVIFVIAGAVGVTRILASRFSFSSSSEQSTGTQPQTYKIPLDINSKQPIATQVKQGDYILFEPTDQSQHQIVSGGTGEHAGDGFDSGVFEPSESYKMQIKDVGVFELNDTYNPDLVITIQATE